MPFGSGLLISEQQVTLCLTPAGFPELLGRGGQGQVLKAKYSGDHVALKLTGEPNAAITDRQSRDAQRELNTLRSLQHPCVVKCLGALIWQGQLGILMELMNQDLRSAMAKNMFMWGPIGLQIAQDVASGLTYLHSCNTLHLDIKSLNILLCGEMRAKIADVGLSRLITGTHLVLTSDAPFSFDWASPEQIESKNLTSASDVFSFGVVLWEIVTGDLPRRRSRRPLSVPQEASQGVQDLIDDCTRYCPAERPSAAAVLARLTSLAHEPGVYGDGAVQPEARQGQTAAANPSGELITWINFGTIAPSPFAMETASAPSQAAAAPGSTLGSQGSIDESTSSDTTSGEQQSSPEPPSLGFLSRPRDRHAWQLDPGRISMDHLTDGRRSKLSYDMSEDAFRAHLDHTTPVSVRELQIVNLPQGLFTALAYEMSVLHSCKHEHMVETHGACLTEEGAQLWIVQEQLGFNLFHELLDMQQFDAISWRHRGKQIALDVAKGLEFLHARDLLHLDLNPMNVLLSSDGRAKIDASGFARTMQSGDRSLRRAMSSGFIKSTWSAPETLKGERFASKANIYSYGVILWQMVTQDFPVRGHMRAIGCPDEAPHCIAELIDACLAQSPQKRPSATGIVHTLQAADQ